MPDRTIIRIRNASFYAYHGVQSDEQSLGGKFEIDVEVHADLLAAMQGDSLGRTIDYEALYALVKDCATSKKFYLIEALAHAIVERALKAFPAADIVQVRVRKPHPPVKGVVDYAEAEVTGHR
jgi:dihydroneopterin aldolase